ncbi:MAG: LysR family transcriptional regulator [Rhodomicrobium sp.]
MEMHEVRYFLAVARTLNFTRAAEECHVAQPSLSRAIKKLEDELGGDLFRRERALTHLTDLGRLMLPVLTQIYNSAITAKTLAAALGKRTVLPLRLALSHTVNLGLFAGILTNLVTSLSGLELKFFRGTADEVGEELKTGRSEVAVAGEIEDLWERYERWLLFSERLWLVVSASHPLAMRNRVDFKDLSGQRIFPRYYCEVFHQLTEIFRSHDISLAEGDQIASDHDLLSLLEANAGVAVLPETMVTDQLRKVMVNGLTLDRSLYVYAVSGRERSPAASAMIKLLRSSDWSRVTMSFASSGEQQEVVRPSR